MELIRLLTAEVRSLHWRCRPSPRTPIISNSGPQPHTYMRWFWTLLSLSVNLCYRTWQQLWKFPFFRTLVQLWRFSADAYTRIFIWCQVVQITGRVGETQNNKMWFPIP